MNKDVETRDQIVFGGYSPEKYFGGVRRFECSSETLRELYKQGFIDGNEAQNESPTTDEFMEFLDFVESKDVTVEFECYAVSPNRDDYRITIEGINLTIPDQDFDLFSYTIANYREADEFDVNHVDGYYSVRAWWD